MDTFVITEGKLSLGSLQHHVLTLDEVASTMYNIHWKTLPYLLETFLKLGWAGAHFSTSRQGEYLLSHFSGASLSLSLFLPLFYDVSNLKPSYTMET